MDRIGNLIRLIRRQPAPTKEPEVPNQVSFCSTSPEKAWNLDAESDATGFSESVDLESLRPPLPSPVYRSDQLVTTETPTVKFLPKRSPNQVRV